MLTAAFALAGVFAFRGLPIEAFSGTAPRRGRPTDVTSTHPLIATTDQLQTAVGARTRATRRRAGQRGLGPDAGDARARPADRGRAARARDVCELPRRRAVTPPRSTSRQRGRRRRLYEAPEGAGVGRGGGSESESIGIIRAGKLRDIHYQTLSPSFRFAPFSGRNVVSEPHTLRLRSGANGREHRRQHTRDEKPADQDPEEGRPDGHNQEGEDRDPARNRRAGRPSFVVLRVELVLQVEAAPLAPPGTRERRPCSLPADADGWTFLSTATVLVVLSGCLALSAVTYCVIERPLLARKAQLG